MESADAARRTRYPLVRRTFIAMLAGGLLAAPLAAGAQPAGKVPRVIRTAKTVGLTVPPSLLLRADFVIQ